MAANRTAADLFLQCFVACTALSVVASLTLPYMVTTKPRHSKYVPPPVPDNGTKASVVAATTATKGVVVYTVTNNNGQTCILLKTDGLIEIYFKTHIGDEQGDTYMSDDAIVEGNCKYEDTASMRISWEGYNLIINFAKTPGGERWFVSQVELIVSTGLERYHNIRSQGKSVKLSHRKMLFPTPVGSSFTCGESIIDLSLPEDKRNPFRIHGKIFLRTFQLQPFMYKGTNFGPVFDCNARLGFRDETASIAVGTTLAVAALGTITGYSIFRYFRVKKVQYSTME